MVRFEDLEIWDYVPWNKNYKVSSKGRVWSVKRNKILSLGKDGHGYLHIKLYENGKPTQNKVHRLVASTFYFAKDYIGYEIDHVDRDKTNNNLLNLRFCSRSENVSNQGIRRDNTSGYKGVTFKEKPQKWVARVTLNGKRKHLGDFNTKNEAYVAYKEASKKYHGEYSHCP